MADKNIESLAKVRTEASGDSRDWTAVDALRDTLNDIETGEIGVPRLIYIAMECETEDKTLVEYQFQCAGGTKLEYIGLLSRHLHQTNASSEEDV